MQNLAMNSANSTAYITAAPCLSKERCCQRFDDMLSTGLITCHYHAHYAYWTKGCFLKNDNVDFGAGGSIADIAEVDLLGRALRRVFCREVPAGAEVAATTAAATKARRWGMQKQLQMSVILSTT